MIDRRTRASWSALAAELRRFVARRVPAADVDDVVQEILLRVQRGVAGLEDAERFGPWVTRIARNCVADRGRARVRAPVAVDIDAVDVDAGPPWAAGDDDDDEQRDVQRGLLACLSGLVAELPGPYRQALVLTELEGLTQERAAHMEGISVSGMKSRVQRGRRMLRALFERCCHTPQDARGRVVACEPWPRAAQPCAAESCACGCAE